MSSRTDGVATHVSSPWPARTGVSRTELDPTSFLARSASVHPDRVAVVEGTRRWTYAELFERTNRLASALRDLGLERHDRVAALCPNIPALLELHHAVPAAGGVLVAINTRLSSSEVRYILDHSGAGMLFVDAALERLGDDPPPRLQIVRVSDRGDADPYEQLLSRGDTAAVPSWLVDEEEPIAID